MASSSPVCIEEAFADSPTPEIVTESQPSPAPPVAPVTPELVPSLTNGSISPPVHFTTKSSTLKKSSCKIKTGRLSKEKDRKYSKTSTRRSPNHLDSRNGECPYSDIDSVPKILCPKALERQRKLVLVQPSITVIKKVKKQPEVQSGLWFSKSGKERRPKTISPTPDRTLFSKVPCKKKNSLACAKKTTGCGASSFGAAASNQVDLQDKHKDDTVFLPLEHSGQSKCKSLTPISKTPVASGSPANSSVAPSDEQDLSVFVNTGVTSDESDYVKARLSDTVDMGMGTMATDQSSQPDSKKSQEPSFKDQTSFAEIAEHVHQDEESNLTLNKRSRESGKESSKTSRANPNLNTTALEMTKSLVSQCRLPYVKLIRKDLKGKIANSGETRSCSDQTESMHYDKVADEAAAKVAPSLTECAENSTTHSVDGLDSLEIINVPVRKLKASGETGLLQLSPEPSHEDGFLPSPEDVVFPPQVEVILPSLEKLILTPTAERVSVKPLNCGSKRKSANKTVSLSSELEIKGSTANIETPSSCTLEHKPDDTAVSQLPRSSDCQDIKIPKCSTSDKPQKNTHKPKPLPEKVKKHTLPQQPAHLPASSRLMTRALKAMQEARQKKLGKAQGKKQKNPVTSSSVSVGKHENKKKTSSKSSVTFPCTAIDRQETVSSSRSTSMSESSDLEVKSEDEDLSVSSTPPMDFIPLKSTVKEKTDGCGSEPLTSSSPPSPFSFMNAFKNVREVSFQSITNEGKQLAFRAEPNYKFSTFLMMLKDLHDTRDRDGTPLELEIGPPAAHVKKEPLMVPGEAAVAADDHDVEHIDHTLASENLCNIAQNVERSFQASRRPPGRKSSSSGARKKDNHKVPSRPVGSGPGYPGLFSLPVEDPSSVSGIQLPKGIQISNWQSQAVGSSSVVQSEDQDEMWSRLMEGHCAERLSQARPRLDLAGIPTGTCTKERRRAMRNVEGGYKNHASKRFFIACTNVTKKEILTS